MVDDAIQTGDVFENEWERWEVISAKDGRIIVEDSIGEEKRVGAREIIEKFAL